VEDSRYGAGRGLEMHLGSVGTDLVLEGLARMWRGTVAELPW
jgi:hypothetical protein